MSKYQWKACNPHNFLTDFDRWFKFEVECAFNNGLPPAWLDAFLARLR